MFSRITSSLGLALLLSMVIAIPVLAKGGFSFITVTGADLKEPVRITDTALTEDFFTFANFFEDGTEAPADPGIGYEITRFYVDDKREIAFDLLHYYPSTGFVFYDGIVNGESEYDGEWYKASPNIAGVFESALSAQTQSTTTSPQPETARATGQSSTLAPERQIMTSIAIIAGLVAVFVLAYRFRKPAAQ